MDVADADIRRRQGGVVGEQLAKERQRQLLLAGVPGSLSPGETLGLRVGG